jgi:hypothetical protein
VSQRIALPDVDPQSRNGLLVLPFSFFLLWRSFPPAVR